MPASSSPYVTLISSDGFEFIVSRDAACVAGTIKKMLDPHSACPHGQPTQILSYRNRLYTDEKHDHRFLRRGNIRSMHPWHDKVRLPSHAARPPPSPFPLLHCPRKCSLRGHKLTRLLKQRGRARESLRVSVLQPEAQRRKGRAGYGDTAGTMLGAIDGGGLLACLDSRLGFLVP